MRFARSVLLGLLVLSFAAPNALAQANSYNNGANGMTSPVPAPPPPEARSFGSVTCRETFNCSSADQVLSNIATGCAAGNLGHPAQFDLSILDTNNCMTSDPADGKSASYVVCCLKPARQDGMCKMGCSLMATGPN